jgi:hypothetical protein
VTLKEVASVIDDINEWPNPHGGYIYFVTAIFTDESVGSAGRKDHDAALEVQGLLREAIGQELDFTLEPKGQTKSGREKFNIKGFGTPGGAATYTAPGVQGGGVSAEAQHGKGSLASTPRGRPPEPSSEQASIRASVALKAAVELLRPLQEKHETGEISHSLVTAVADWMYDWLESKTSEPALREYPQPVVAAPSESSTDHQPGAGSEDSSAGGPLGPPFQPPADSEGGVATKGKEPAPSSHEHDWQPHPNLHGWLSCECGENRKKYAP